MRKGFTLLELIIVIIIIGILATLGFVQYAQVIEKSRVAEARMNLGTLRQLELAYFEDPINSGTFAEKNDVTDNLNTSLPGACATGYYFSYVCDPATGTCTATRCTVGETGKPPGWSTAYAVNLTPAGVLTCTSCP